MEKKYVVIDGQTFINSSLVADSMPAPAPEPASSEADGSFAVMACAAPYDGVQSVAKTNVGKPRWWTHADGRVEFNEDVDWTNAESVLSFIQDMASETELGASLAKVRSGVFAALNPKPDHPASLEDRVKSLEAKVLDLQGKATDDEISNHVISHQEFIENLVAVGLGSSKRISRPR